jgi:hypothetical protein
MPRRRYELRDRIAALDPERDHLKIYQLSAGREFPWDYTRALEFALFRTYCVPSISRLLAATGEFRDRPQKRYDDTSLLMAEIAAHGYDSPRGREALKVVNRQVGEYTVGLFAAWFPGFLRPAVRLAVRGMLDEPMLRAFGFRPAPRWVGAIGELGLRTRAWALRFFPPRREPVLGVSPRNRTYPGYPGDYQPADLGVR